MASKPSLLIALAALLSTASTQGTSGTGTTTRYWDCCKPSCAWNDLSTLAIESSVISCNKNDRPLSTNTDKSGCQSGGTAYMCSSQSPWAISATEAYGFAAVSASGSPPCCQCYELTFTSTSLATSGKKMIVQATNTGGDVSATQFDIAMPGGGFGIFDGCTTEWPSVPASAWGAQYGGASSDTCPQFTTPLQPGCQFRWNWYEGADNPTVSYKAVACPAAITAKSGCVRVGDTPTGPSSVATWTSGAASPTTTAGSGKSTTPTTVGSKPTEGSGTVPQYQQCGGIGWTGSGACVAGTSCTVINSYYSQCL